MPLARPRIRLIPLVYLVVGLAVANSHDYLKNVDTVRTVGSAILAILLWPLILLGIDLHVHR